MLLLVVVLAFVVPVSWALADLLRRPKEAFATAGRNRTVWLALLVVALAGPFLIGTPPVVSTGLGIWYLVAVRRKVAAATSPSTPSDER